MTPTLIERFECPDTGVGPYSFEYNDADPPYCVQLYGGYEAKRQPLPEEDVYLAVALPHVPDYGPWLFGFAADGEQANAWWHEPEQAELLEYGFVKRTFMAVRVVHGSAQVAFKPIDERSET